MELKTNFKKNVILAFIISIPVLSIAQDFEWVRQLGGADLDYSSNLAVNSSNDLVATGSFQGSVSLGATTITSNGGSDIYLARYSAGGNLLWINAFGGTTTDYPGALTVDHSDNIYVMASFRGSMDIDPSGNVVTLNATPPYFDNFLAKFDVNGQLIWAKEFDNTSIIDAQMTHDSQNNIYISGYFRDSLDLDLTTGTHMIYSNGDTDLFVAKYDSDGNFLWEDHFGSSVQELNAFVTIDHNDNVFVSGTFQNTISVSGISLTSGGTYDQFIASYSSSGSLVYARKIGGTGEVFGAVPVVDSQNNIYIAGNYNGSIDFDPGASSQTLSSSSYQGYVLKLDASGNFVWVKSLNGSGNMWLSGIAMDMSDHFYITGTFSQTFDFNPGGGTAQLTAIGSEDIFIGRYTSNGIYVKAGIMAESGANGDKSLRSTVSDSGNNIFVSGSFYGNSDFDPYASGTAIYSNGYNDGFIVKFSECIQPDQPTVLFTDTTICQGDSVILGIEPSANLNSADYWGWYPGFCNSQLIGQGSSIKIGATYSQGYYVRAVGNCITSTGCEDIVVNVTSVDTTISESQGVLTSNQTNADSYSWHLCSGEIFNYLGQLEPDFTPTYTGSYAVYIEKEGCAVMSECFEISSLANTNEQIKTQLQVYPNPSSGAFSLRGLEGAQHILIYNSQGIEVFKTPCTSETTFIDVNDLPSGIYLLRADQPHFKERDYIRLIINKK